MFVDSINIKQFRGIKSCKKALELSRINILFGRNNSGKSTILEALSLLPNPLTACRVTDNNKIDLLKELHKTENRSNIPLLYFYSGRAEIDYVINHKEYSISIDKTNTEIYITDQKKKLSDRKQHVMNFFDTKRLADLVLYFPYDTEVVRKMEKKIQDLKYEINKEGFNVKIATYINECLDDNYSEIIFQENIVLRKILGKQQFNYVRLGDLGSGAEKTIKIMALVEVIKPKLILIDDFGAGLHPSLIDVFLNWMNESGIQLVISTHSIDVLYRLTEIQPDDTNILFIKKSQTDIIDYKKRSLDEIEDFLNSNSDPRKMGI